MIRHIIDKSDTTENADDMTNDQIVQQMTDIHLFANTDMENIQNIKRKIQQDIEKNEVLLDLHCDEISRGIGANAFTMNGANSTSALNSDRSKLNGMNHDAKANKTLNSPPSSTLNSEQTKARRPSSLPRFNINSSGRMMQRIPIDPQKKSKLLAQLKSIEAANANL